MCYYLNAHFQGQRVRQKNAWTAGMGRFGEEWEGDLNVQLYVEQASRKLFCNTLYRGIGWATCYPEALLSSSSVHPGEIIK
jgi:hypothetical protein